MSKIHQGFNTIAENISKISEHNIKGKQFLVTGTTAGLGLETVRCLLKQGGQVTCACRNTALMQEHLAQFNKEFGSVDLAASSKVISLDLTDFGSIREFCKTYSAEVGKLDTLILNAGIMACPQSLTKDGHEMQQGTNHLGHQLLTALLKDLLLQSESPRHITVSSQAHSQAKERQIEFDDILSSDKTQDASRRYGMSKLANVQFARGLAARWGDKVKCQSLHPGVIQTELGRHVVTGCMKCMFPCLLGIAGLTNPKYKEKTIPEGAATQMQAAVSDDVLALPNGSQLDDCGLGKVEVVLKDDVQQKLFDISAEATGEKIEKI